MNALDVLCAQLMRDLFAIAKFLYQMAARHIQIQLVDCGIF